MGKFLFFDIDGTLSGKSRVITEKTKQAIQTARKNGHKAFLCTGRAPTSIMDDILNIGFDGVVCSAGGFVIVDGEFIFENIINQYLLSEVMTLFINNHILFSLETKNAIYETAGVTKFFDNRHATENLELQRFFKLRRQGEHRLPINDFNILNTGVTKVCFIAPHKEDFFNCVKFLEDYFNIVCFSKEEDEYVNGEIIIKNCTKADGILRVVNHFNGKMQDTIAFGDSMNDYEMIKEAEIGVVYKDACEALKKEASYFFDDPDNEGIYKIMNELKLI